MPTKIEFIKGFHGKMMTLENVNAWLRQGSEFEILTKNDQDDVRVMLNRIDGGLARNIGINDRNGWFNDVHKDGWCRLDGADRYVNGEMFYATEVPTSPLHGVNYGDMKAEYEKLFDRLTQATGKVLHNSGGSCHMHTAMAYADVEIENDRYGDHELEIVVQLPSRQMYRNIGGFFVRFMPVLKWLSMTNPNGTRGNATGNFDYDRCSNDQLFEWFDMVNHYGRHTSETDDTLYNMARYSYLRIDPKDRESCFHWENRILDCNLSPTLMAAWGALNRAITLFAYDMVRNNFEFIPTQQQVWNSKDAMRAHERGYKEVRKQYIEDSYKEMMSLLYKYFKKASSLGAIEVFNKLIEKPIPEYVNEKRYVKNYDINVIDLAWGGRNRAKDEVLRGVYLTAIRTMQVPIADKLMGEEDSFNANIAKHLKIQYRQAVSLYQMFRREFEEGKTLVNLEFNFGRLMDMSEM